MKCCFNGSEGNLFCFKLSWGMKNGFISRTRSGKNHGFHLVKSTLRRNCFGRKRILCVWWDQCGVMYFELLKPGETVNTDRYRQQIINLNHALIEKRPEWARRH